MPDLLKISAVIPTLNEAAYIERALTSVQIQPGPTEIIVADGGSADGTREFAALQAQIVTGARGRAQQMNRGAAAATGDVLLFLHADTQLPPDGFAAIRRTLAQPDAEAGVFRLRFDREAPLLRFYSFVTRAPWHRLAFGDRALFVRRSVFEATGGFPDWPIFEDLELARRLAGRGSLRFLSEAVTTSARRFDEHGTFLQQMSNLALWLRYLAGTNPERIAHRYRYERSN